MGTHSHREGCSYSQNSRCLATRHITQRAVEWKSVLKDAFSIFSQALHFLIAGARSREGTMTCSRQDFSDHSLDS